MDAKLDNLFTLTERMLLHVEHGIPPEHEVTLEIKKLIDELRKEHCLPLPVTKSLPGTA